MARVHMGYDDDDEAEDESDSIAGAAGTTADDSSPGLRSVPVLNMAALRTGSSGAEGGGEALKFPAANAVIGRGVENLGGLGTITWASWSRPPCRGGKLLRSQLDFWQGGAPGRRGTMGDELDAETPGHVVRGEINPSLHRVASAPTLERKAPPSGGRLALARGCEGAKSPAAGGSPSSATSPARAPICLPPVKPGRRGNAIGGRRDGGDHGARATKVIAHIHVHEHHHYHVRVAPTAALALTKAKSFSLLSLPIAQGAWGRPDHGRDKWSRQQGR